MKTKSINRNSAFLASLLPFFYLALILSKWLPLKVAGILGPRKYMDLNWVLVSAQCDQKKDADIYAPFNGDLCSGYIYGKPLIYVINLLNIKPTFTNMIGIVLSLVVVVSLFFIAYFSFSNTNNSKSKKFASFIILLSPGFWLLLERGNIDSVILIMVLIAAYSKMNSKEVTSIILISITALFKFYTLPLIYIIHHHSRSYIRWLALISTLFVAAYSLQTVISIPQFPSTWYVSFGSPSMGLYYNLAVEHLQLSLPSVSTVIAQMAGVIILFGLVLFILKKISIQTYSESGSDEVEIKVFKNLFIFFGSLHAICFIAGMSYDYRLSFASIALIALMNIIKSEILVRCFVTASALSMWLSCFDFGVRGLPFVLMQFIGDLLLFPLTAFVIAGLIQSNRKRP